MAPYWVRSLPTHWTQFLFLQSHWVGELVAKIPVIVVCTRYQVSQMAPWEGCQGVQEGSGDEEGSGEGINRAEKEEKRWGEI